MITFVKLAGCAAVLWWLQRQKHPDANVLLSSNVVQNGQCVRVDLLATGGTRNVPVPMSTCNADAGGGDLDNPVDDPAVGFYQLAHLFDDL